MKKTLTLKGFTLIELGVVIVAISILTGIIVPTLQGYIEDAEKASDYANAALIYNDVSLVISADDDAYLSFFADVIDNSGSSKKCQYPVAEMVKDRNGNWIQKWKKDENYKTSIITRCSGVDYDTALRLAAKQGQGYDAANKTKELTGQNTGKDNWHGLHDPFGYKSEGKGSKRIIYTWEPVLNDKEMNREKILKNVRDNNFGWGSGKDSHKYFTMLLCEKEKLPLWNNNVSEKEGSKVPIQMRYYKGNTNPDKGKNSAGVQYLFSDSDYVWEWMITYNPDTLEPEIFAGNGQGNLVRRVYPDVDSHAVIYDW